MLEDGLKKEFRSRIEQVKEEIERGDVTLGYLIGSAKRIRRDDKKIVTYRDDLSKKEADLFKEDYYLAGLILEKKKIDRQITEHIDKTVILFREKQHRLEIEKTKKIEEDGLDECE